MFFFVFFLFIIHNIKQQNFYKHHFIYVGNGEFVSFQKTGVIKEDRNVYQGRKAWFIYRGDIFRSDDEGTRARISSNDRYEFGISGGGNFPVDSNKIKARNGMPNLDFLFGLGPNFLYRLIKYNNRHQLNVNLGARLNISTNFKSFWLLLLLLSLLSLFSNFLSVGFKHALLDHVYLQMLKYYYIKSFSSSLCFSSNNPNQSYFLLANKCR